MEIEFFTRFSLLADQGVFGLWKSASSLLEGDMMHGNCTWFGERNTFHSKQTLCQNYKIFSTFFGR